MLQTLPCTAEAVVENLLPRHARVLLLGQPGVGKSTLAAGIAAELASRGRSCHCISADPGTPAFGVPGAIGLGRWQDGVWSLQRLEALCSLDAARFRLPLVTAVRRLAGEVTEGVLLLDSPGVVRGIAAAELLEALVEAAAIQAVVLIARERLPMQAELAALGLPVFHARAPQAASRPARRARDRARTRQWDDWLAAGAERSLPVDALQRVGMPPPLDRPDAWRGRQVALLEGRETRAMGEVLSLSGTELRLRVRPGDASGRILLVRDAWRSADGLLTTVPHFGVGAGPGQPPADVRPYGPTEGGPVPVARVGMATAVMVNGVFGDALLHLRLHHQRRSLLFDLGEGSRLPARVAHQVTDVFVSHAHIDHIAGFLWFLRSRIGDFPPTRFFGPPGLAGHLEGMVAGVHWDRIGARGPVLEVHEVHGESVRMFRLQAGQGGAHLLGDTPLIDGVLRDEPAFRVRTTTLDHRTPVLAFAFEPPRQLNVRKDRLDALGLQPGPWLTELKRHVAAGAGDVRIALPGGERRLAGELAEELLLIQPGKKLVYATDFADIADNRRRITRLARGAHTLFCEATFLEADRAQAERTGHLTARACGEIATAADVTYLMPFHFSRRYEGQPERVYEEIQAVCSRLVIPRVHRLP